LRISSCDFLEGTGMHKMSHKPPLQNLGKTVEFKLLVRVFCLRDAYISSVSTLSLYDTLRHPTFVS